MNEKLQYMAMLGVPENTSTITIKPTKKKKSKKKQPTIEDVKQKVIEKVNETTVDTKVEEIETENVTTENQNVTTENSTKTVKAEEVVIDETKNVEPTKTIKHKKRSMLVRVQVAIIGVLLGVILLTNVINKNSGINVFMKNIFSPQPVVSDQRVYTDFAPVFSYQPESLALLDGGVISASEVGSVYSWENGQIDLVEALEDSTYRVVIKHSENFSTSISGLKFVYGQYGDKVLTNVPVGYASESGVSMCFIGKDGSVITDYDLTDNSVVWAV